MIELHPMRTGRTDRHQLTDWSPATTMLETQWGLVSYRQWCELEAARYKSHGQLVEVRQVGKLVCLCRIDPK